MKYLQLSFCRFLSVLLRIAPFKKYILPYSRYLCLTCNKPTWIYFCSSPFTNTLWLSLCLKASEQSFPGSVFVWLELAVMPLKLPPALSLSHLCITGIIAVVFTCPYLQQTAREGESGALLQRKNRWGEDGASLREWMIERERIWENLSVWYEN